MQILQKIKLLFCFKAFFIIFLFIFLLFGQISQIKAQEIREYTPTEIKQLTQVKYTWIALDSLQAQKIISVETANQQKKVFQNQASKILNVTDEKKLQQIIMTIDEYEGKSLLTRIKGFFGFINVVTILSALLLVVAVVGIMQTYFKKVIGWITIILNAIGFHKLMAFLGNLPLLLYTFFAKAPMVVYEILLYVMCGSAIYVATLVRADIQGYVAFLGCFGFIWAFVFTFRLHKIGAYLEKIRYNRILKLLTITIIHSIFISFWGACAVYFQSILIGFMAILAIFTFLFISLSIILSTKKIIDGDAIESRHFMLKISLTSGFLMLAGYILFNVQGLSTNNYVFPFNYGTAIISCLGYFTSLLTISNRGYLKQIHKEKYLPTYIIFQTIAIISILLGLYIDFLYNISFLRSSISTFFIIYFIAKYYELPWEKIGWAWSLLGLAGILYGVSILARIYPTYFFM